MTPIDRITAVAAPILRDNVDTDAIIPSREMKSTGKTGLSDGLFAASHICQIGSVFSMGFTGVGIQFDRPLKLALSPGPVPIVISHDPR